MRRGFTNAFAAGLAAAALLSAGCGGGDDGGGSGGEQDAEITDVLETVFSSDPEQCSLFTDAAYEQLAQAAAEADDPRKECVESLKEEPETASVEVESVEVDGSTAEAVVVPDGGTFAGTRVTVALVHGDGAGWKVDGVDDIEVLDRSAYLASISKATAAASHVEEGDADATCISEELGENASDDELAATVVDEDNAVLYDAVVTCLGGGDDLIAIVTVIENQLVEEGIPEKTARCVAGSSIPGIHDATFAEFAEDSGIELRVFNAAKRALSLCA